MMSDDIPPRRIDATPPPSARNVPAVAPVILVAVGYMDPGNWASAIEGGSRFGFELLWVVILANVMAALFQTLATRLGLVSGKHLAEICREDYPKPVCLLLWALSEVSIIALDLTMVVGTAVGLNLLFGSPIFPSVLVLAFDGIILRAVLSIVGVHRVELVAGSVVGVVLVCFGLGTLLSRPSVTAVIGGLWPKVRGDSLYTAVGLLGANVVPHTFYLHSAILQRQHNLPGQSKDIVCQENMRDVIGAFGIALLANVAVLVVAASTFHNVGLVILNLQDAHALMEQILSNSIAPAAFGLALLCAGQLSALTGTLTGKVTMEGFLDMSMQPWLHRSLVRGAAVIPAAFCAWHYGSEGLYRLLLFSQIIIAAELPFSAVPLIKASSSEARMGSYRISSLVETVAWLSVALVVVANIWLVFDLMLEEIDEFSGFAAHLESLLGTDSFGHYGEDTLNTSVFALVLVIIGLCVGFLVWLVVTPLRVDRIAMERKWVEEYELFERNEGICVNQVDDGLGSLDFPSDPTTADDRGYPLMPMTECILLEAAIVDLEYPPGTETAIFDQDNEPDLDLGRRKLATWTSTVSTSSSDIDDICSVSTSKLVDTSNLPEPFQVDIMCAPDVVQSSEPHVSQDKQIVPKHVQVDGVLNSPERADDIREESLPEVLEPAVKVVTAICIGAPAGTDANSLDSNASPNLPSSVVEETKDLAPDVALEVVPLGVVVLTEPEIAGTIETFLKLDASFSAKEATEKVPMPIQITPRRQVSLGGDDAESVALKKAEAEADADMIEKDDDEVDDLEHEDVVVGSLSQGNLAHSYSNLAHEGSGSARSLGGRSDTSEGSAGGSGSGSLSRLSGLGRAARRQFAAYLDEFWGRLFDLHGQTIAAKGASGSGRNNAMGSAAGSSFGSSVAPISVDNGAHLGRLSSSTANYLSRDSGSGYSSKLEGSKSTSSLQYSMDQMDAYARAHTSATASTSSGFLELTQDYSGRSGSSLSPFLNERQYSSMHLPSYSGEFDRQPATIHGYHAPSFLGRIATSSPALKSSRPMQSDMHSSASARALSGQQPHAQQPLGIGVEREIEASQLYGRYFQGGSFEDTLQSLRSSQLSMNSLANRSLYKMNGDGDLNGPRSWDSRMAERTTVDPLVYRATGELHMPSSLHSPIGRLGSMPGNGDRAPLSFDDLSPSQSRRDGFSIQFAQPENSLWSRQPFEQYLGGVMDNGGPARSRSGSLGPSRSGSIGRAVKADNNSDSMSNPSAAFVSGADSADLDIMENLRNCICKLLCLDGSEWLFRVDNGADEDLVAAVAALEKVHLEADAPDRVSRSWQAHGRPVSSLLKVSNEPRRVCHCGEACVWGRGLLVSFGVWCVHRVLELSLMESRPELWGKYTYVLNRLQGVLEPAFSKPRIVTPMCSCVLDAGADILIKRGRGGLIKQGSGIRDLINADLHTHGCSPQTYPYPWPWGRNSSSSKGRGASATVFLEMIKEVEQAVGSRKGRTGTAAGDVAFPKGKENLASVLKRYKRRLGNKPPGAVVGGGGGGSGGSGGGRRSNGYAQALVFAASCMLLPPC
ncbi:hypothetical protein KC19_VG229100 [Ceratodon purpureus]|uniref:Uncharacterized protein n=1 Tax=Ceratodon purpureus TaxID=3225 RepID=A0A8T0HSS4_CERPU|nr:hypothetical protein KC19_VG229100 [Ceratodon purpureus]